ncbi:hypothetical protein DM01DRAFT_1383956 [Hesseltinella vesiculosa]|uniref:SH3 domain-containing protein n=1 Tax=Hesseltinella vesiculosa TaxID=101127 RepID=A0A1X2GFY8_9FUNG|nr:hypothetical protein DM01DRAFT_1383956 [Hesseltinella vesiculosa]
MLDRCISLNTSKTCAGFQGFAVDSLLPQISVSLQTVNDVDHWLTSLSQHHPFSACSSNRPPPPFGVTLLCAEWAWRSSHCMPANQHLRLCPATCQQAHSYFSHHTTSVTPPFLSHLCSSSSSPCINLIPTGHQHVHLSPRQQLDNAPSPVGIVAIVIASLVCFVILGSGLWHVTRTYFTFARFPKARRRPINNAKHWPWSTDNRPSNHRDHSPLLPLAISTPLDEDHIDEMPLLTQPASQSHPLQFTLTSTIRDDPCFCEAIYVNQPEWSVDLTLSKGDLIYLFCHTNEDWAIGYNLNSRVQGYFPLICIRSITMSEVWRIVQKEPGLLDGVQFFLDQHQQGEEEQPPGPTNTRPWLTGPSSSDDDDWPITPPAPTFLKRQWTLPNHRSSSSMILLSSWTPPSPSTSSPHYAKDTLDSQISRHASHPVHPL